MYHAQAQLHSCNQFHKRNATHDWQRQSVSYIQKFIFTENQKFQSFPWISSTVLSLGVQQSLHCVDTDRQYFYQIKMFSCSVLAAVIARFVTQSNPNFGIYCLPCNLHQIAPKLQEIHVCCTEVFQALHIGEIHICHTKHKCSQKLTVPTYEGRPWNYTKYKYEILCSVQKQSRADCW